jgi:inner membrane protein
MDNVTHTLIGVGLFRLLPKRLRRPETFWAATVGNNIPDSDVLERLIPGTDDLNYIVHHRGYTHGLAFAVPLGILIGIVFNRVFKKKWNSPAALVVGGLSGLFHVLADGMNSYGIHPFTPFLDRWYYGDSVFIVEPLLWCSLVPVAILTVERRWAKATWAGLLIALLILTWFIPTLTPAFSLTLAAIAGILAATILKTKNATIGLALAGISLASLFTGGAIARSKAENAWKDANTSIPLHESLLDIESTPSPGNPFCWRVWTRSENESAFISRMAGVSLLPGVFPSKECPLTKETPKKALPTALTIPPTNGRVDWVFETTLDKSLHGLLLEKSCRYQRFLNFARLPYVTPIGIRPPIESWLAGDLRYDRNEEFGFSDFAVTLEDECNSATNVWERPTERPRG